MAVFVGWLQIRIPNFIIRITDAPSKIKNNLSYPRVAMDNLQSVYVYMRSDRMPSFCDFEVHSVKDCAPSVYYAKAA